MGPFELLDVVGLDVVAGHPARAVPGVPRARLRARAAAGAPGHRRLPGPQGRPRLPRLLAADVSGESRRDVDRRSTTSPGATPSHGEPGRIARRGSVRDVDADVPRGATATGWCARIAGAARRPRRTAARAVTRRSGPAWRTWWPGRPTARRPERPAALAHRLLAGPGPARPGGAARPGRPATAERPGSTPCPHATGRPTAAAIGRLGGEHSDPREVDPARPPRGHRAAHRRRAARWSASWPCRRTATPVATLVCLHPLPTHGGMMDSHVFRKAACRLPALADLAVLRFNTRGTSSVRGTSEGAFDDARGRAVRRRGRDRVRRVRRPAATSGCSAGRSAPTWR